MKKVSYFPYFTLALLLFTILSLPKRSIDPLRSVFISGFVPSWNKLHAFRSLFLAVPTFSKNPSQSANQEKEQKLLLENRVLKEQMQAISEWLMFDQKIDQQSQLIKEISEEEQTEKDPFWREFFFKRAQELKITLEKQVQAYPAQVVFREPSSWSSSIWINVGQKQNVALGKTIIAKNSPVVLGESLIGVIEYVGAKQSRVRLVTDSRLRPSVRAVRGNPQDRALYILIQSLSDRLNSRSDLFQSPNEKDRFLQLLGHVKKRIKRSGKGIYIAKGELAGSSYPLWRSRGQILKGIGFHQNQDFFKCSAVSPKSSNFEEEELLNLQVGDLLVTSGLDGVFPPGLQVGLVSKLHENEDSRYYYEIEAKPTAGDLDDLSQIFVLPPLEFDMNLENQRNSPL